MRNLTKSLIIIILVVGSLAIPIGLTESNGIWIQAEDIRSGEFGADEEKGEYSFPNNLGIDKNISVNDTIFYRGKDINLTFITYGENNSITSRMISPNSVGEEEIKEDQVQVRVDEDCPKEYAIRQIHADGSVTCEKDSTAEGKCPKNTYMVGINGKTIICKSAECKWSGDYYISGEKWTQTRDCKYSCGKTTCSGNQSRTLRCDWGSVNAISGWDKCN